MVAVREAAAPNIYVPRTGRMADVGAGLPASQPNPAVRTAPRPTARASRGGRIVTAVLVAAVVVFGLVLVNIYLAQTSFELSEVQGRVIEEQSRQRHLRSEVAAAESPERLDDMARELGLVVPAETLPLD